MHALGIIKVQNRLRWVLLRHEKTVIIERMEESEAIPEDVLSIKNLNVVTGLEGTAVLRRDLKLPLTTEKTLKAALPFQLEPLLPFSLEDSIVYPQFHRMGKETFVVAWATTRENVRSHLEKWESLGIEPDFVANETLALARWALHVFPEESEFTLMHETLGIAIDHGRIVCAMESADPARLKLFLKQKYPLFHCLEESPSTEAGTYAIPMGLALEAFQKESCQFRSHSFPSSRQKKRERTILRTVVGAGLGLLVLTALVSAGVLLHHEKELKNQISRYYQGEVKTLEAGVESLRESLAKKTKTAPPVYTAPTAQEVLAWLSSLPAPVDIQHFEYELKGATRVEISLEFQAEASSDADLFVKQLRQAPTFVESTHELKWTSHPQGYKLSFPLQKNS